MLILVILTIYTLIYIVKSKRYKSPNTYDHTPKIKMLPNKHYITGDWNSICNNIENANEYHTENIKKYGTHQFSLPFSPIYINLEPNEENLKHILLKNFANYIKDDEQKLIFGELFGNGIFATDNIDWKISRLTMSSFLMKNHTYIKELFQEQILNLVLPVNIVEKVDIQKIFFELTAKSSFQMIFGINVDNEEINKCAEMFDKCQELMFKRYFKPWWKIERYLNIGDEKIINKNIKILDDFCFEHIKNPDGLVKYCIDNELDKMETRDIIMNMLIASRDTTATALTWCIYEIIQNQDLIDKLRTDEEFLISFINETLRLHPPIPSDTKMVVEDDILPDGTRLPAKSIIIYRPYSHGRLLYKDGDKFDTNRKHKSQYYSPIFNAGPRICLGKNLALLQIKLVLSTLINKYDFNGFICENPKWIPGITLRMKDGLYVYINNKFN